MKKIIIASQNPVKIAAVRHGFEKMFPSDNFDFSGISVASGIADQPFGNEETLQGALNRANNASQEQPEADFWVGIEGGIQRLVHEMEAFAWVAVKSRDNKIGKSRTSTFFLPTEIIKLINQGMELGEADDIVFKRTNSKQQNGAVGILTENIIDREKYYLDAVILALIPFKNASLY